MLLGLSFLALNFAFSQVKFIENKGQWCNKATYKAALTNGDLWLTDSGLLFSLWDPSAGETLHDKGLAKFTLKQHAFYLHFKGGNMANITAGGETSEEYYNYFLEKDPLKWKGGLHANTELWVRNIYDGVDLQIFSSNGNLKYNLICNKPENISQIRLQYIGVDSINITNNHIELKTSVQEFIEAMPLVLGTNKLGNQEISAKYKMFDDGIGFEIPSGVQSRYSQIVIDPILVFSTYSGSKADNFGCTGTYDDLGFSYSGGTVFDFGFPVTLGAFQTSFKGGVDENLSYGGGRDVGILKYTPDGKSLVYCTYLGGFGNEQPHSMVTNALHELQVVGSTRSTNFPVSATAFDKTQNGDYDFFITHFSADGKSIIGSTYIGGSGMDASGADRENNGLESYPLLFNYADEFRGEILCDANNIYVGGITYSSDFPGLNTPLPRNQDGCVFSMSADLSKLNWSTVIGTSNFDAIYGIALGKSNDIYASGGTNSNDLGIAYPTFKKAYAGGIADAMALRLNRSDGSILQSTYFGTAAYEQAYFVQTDNSGNPYFYGQTDGVFPIVNSPYNQPGKGQFIVRFDTALSNYTLSTTFGANNNGPNISPSAFLVDRCERIFVSGWGGGTNSHVRDAFTGKAKAHFNRGSTYNMQVTSDALQKTTDGSDFYIAVFSKNMYALSYATFFGGIGAGTKSADEHVDGGTSRFDKKGIIYQAVCAGCGKNGLFPTTPGAYSRTNNSFNCNNALFKIDFQNLNKKPFMTDTFIKVVATDNIDFTKIAKDPDPFDTLQLKVFVINKAGIQSPDTPIFTLTKGIGKASLRLAWNTKCNSWSTDTVQYRIMIYDKGCPNADTTWATLKILVTEPPKAVPPDAICVSYDRAIGELKISWPVSNQDARFFSHFLLKRIDPLNQETMLLQINNTAVGSYIDVAVVNPSTNNYCYWLEGYNTCGTLVKAAMPFCTVQELNNPITGVRMKFATVENDKRVKIEWEKSQEPDFKEYELYKFERSGSPGKVQFAYSKDTFFRDSSFNVDNESWCYSIVVTDKCGHASNQSNKGCNVIINGTATGRPEYYFDLKWQDYEDWGQGVKDWTLERQYASNPWTMLANTGANQNYKDDKLDFDWGGYWYRVTATEYLKSPYRAPYQSQSNWIYLYQPPELWVPNAFTPNENGMNDVWGTVPVFVRNYNMKVYNRWGQKVWESTAKKLQWDGTVDGKLAEDGVFAWYVQFDGWDDKKYTMKGTVTVIH